jgi:hypothetical protein
VVAAVNVGPGFSCNARRTYRMLQPPLATSRSPASFPKHARCCVAFAVCHTI